MDQCLSERWRGGCVYRRLIRVRMFWNVFLGYPIWKMYPGVMSLGLEKHRIIGLCGGYLGYLACCRVGISTACMTFLLLLQVVLLSCI